MIRALSLTLLLSGCGALNALGGATTPLDAYQIRASADAPVAAGRAQPVDVIIEVPSAGAALDTESILIRPQPTQVQYLPDARWIETTPEMIQTALVDGLDRSGGFRFVGRRPLGSSGDYALVTALTEFEAVLIPETGGAEIRIRLTARLIREDDLAIVGSETFAASIAVPSTESAVLVQGFDAARNRSGGRGDRVDLGQPWRGDHSALTHSPEKRNHPPIHSNRWVTFWSPGPGWAEGIFVAWITPAQRR